MDWVLLEKFERRITRPGRAGDYRLSAQFLQPAIWSLNLKTVMGVDGLV